MFNTQIIIIVVVVAVPAIGEPLDMCAVRTNMIAFGGFLVRSFTAEVSVHCFFFLDAVARHHFVSIFAFHIL